MGTAIVGILLLTAVCLIIRNMIRKKRNGKSVGCGCGCENCSGCH